MARRVGWRMPLGTRPHEWAARASRAAPVQVAARLAARLDQVVGQALDLAARRQPDPGAAPDLAARLVPAAELDLAVPQRLAPGAGLDPGEQPP